MRTHSRLVVAMAGVVLGAVSCSLLVSTSGLDDAPTSTAADAAADAAIDQGVKTGDDGAAKEGSVVDPGDGNAADSPTSTTDGSTCKKSGDKQFPVVAFDATPAASGTACGVANILADDGVVAGLDRLDADPGLIVGSPQTDCVGADFGAGASITKIIVRMAPGGNACNQTPCIVEDGGCGTGHDVTLFAGLTMATLARLPDVTMTSTTLTDYEVDTNGARFVVVCRQPWGEERDDVLVDSIATPCP